MHTHGTSTRAPGAPINVQVIGARTPLVQRVVSILRDSGAGSVSLTSTHRRSLAVVLKQRLVRRSKERGKGFRARLRYMDRADVYVVNCLREDGTSSPTDVARAVGSIHARVPNASIVALIDETNPSALRAAREAGATSFLGASEAWNAEAVSWRLGGLRPVEAAPASPRPHAPRKGTRPSPREVADAVAAVNASVSALPSPAERLARAAEWVRVDAPTLRDPESGRFDAKRIAAALGISLARLAPAAGVSQQALSAKPDSPRAQAGLQSVARVLAALDELLPSEQQRMWLNMPRAQFDGATPLALIEQGQAESLARAVQAALEGDPG